MWIISCFHKKKTKLAKYRIFIKLSIDFVEIIQVDCNLIILDI